MEKQNKKPTVPTRKKANQQITLVRKANELVEARYKFDIWETRIFLEMLTKINPADTGFTDYKIYLKEFVKDFFLEDNKNTYRLAKEASKKLMGKLIEARINRGDGKMEDFVTPVVTSFKGRDQDSEEASYIKLSFHPDMRPFLLELKERYVTYDFSNVANLSSPYYVRIYELLKQYEKIGKRRIAVEELKAMLGIVNEYKSYGHFKDKIIEKSRLNLLKYTDIGFTYEELTGGSKKVMALNFHIFRNVPEYRPQRPERTVRPPILPAQTTPPVPHLFSSLTPLAGEEALFTAQSKGFLAEKTPFSGEGGHESKILMLDKSEITWLDNYADILRQKWGISPSHFILKAHGRQEADIKRAISFTEERIQLGKAVNPAGVFLDALEKGYSSPTQQKAEMQARIRAEAAERRKRLEELDARKTQLGDELDRGTNDIVRDIVQADPSVTDRAIEEIKLMFTHLRDRTLDEFRKSPMLRGLVIGKIKTMFPERFSHLVGYETEIKNLNSQIEGLKKI
jgi:hypothetical protein